MVSRVSHNFVAVTNTVNVIAEIIIRQNVVVLHYLLAE